MLLLLLLLSSVFFPKILVPKIFSGIPSVSISFDSDQAQHFVRPDLGPN